MILTTEEDTVTLKVIAATTKMILATENKVITATLNIVSSTTKVSVTIEEVTTTTFKVISTTILVILATEEWSHPPWKLYQPLQRWSWPITHWCQPLRHWGIITATTKANDSPVLLLESNSKYLLNIQPYNWDWWRLDLHDNFSYVYFVCFRSTIRLESFRVSL